MVLVRFRSVLMKVLEVFSRGRRRLNSRPLSSTFRKMVTTLLLLPQGPALRDTRSLSRVLLILLAMVRALRPLATRPLCWVPSTLVLLTVLALTHRMSRRSSMM